VNLTALLGNFVVHEPNWLVALLAIAKQVPDQHFTRLAGSDDKQFLALTGIDSTILGPSHQQSKKREPPSNAINSNPYSGKTERGTPSIRVTRKIVTAENISPTSTAFAMRIKSGIDANRQTPL
jgi:hypothetical protein